MKTRSFAKFFDIIEEFSDEYQYHGTSWDYQVAHRLVMRLKRTGHEIEGSIYKQCLGENPIKIALEVSESYGCPVGCLYCASGNLRRPFLKLSATEITSQVEILLSRLGYPTLNKDIPVLVCYQGIGEPTICSKEIIESALEILEKYPKISFKLATMGFKPREIPSFAKHQIPWTSIQVTLPHWDNEKLRWLFPGCRKYSIEHVLEGIKLFMDLQPEVKIKFNYPCLIGFNSKTEDLQKTVALLASQEILSEKNVELKLSFLNPTSVAKQNGIKGASMTEIKKLLRFLQETLEVKSSYIFGPENKIKVGCGQLIYNSDLEG